MNVESGLQIDLLSALKRRAWLTVFVAGAIFLVGYWVAMALPNEYTSYATLLVEPQAISDTLVEAGVAGSDLNNRLHLMTAEILSRPRLSRIIDELDLYEDESNSMLREEVIDLLRSKISVVPVYPELSASASGRQKGGGVINTFQIYFTSHSPTVAASVAQRLANDFIEEHISVRVQMTGKSLEFIGAEQERLKTAIRRVDAQVAEVKDANPGRLPEDMLANQRLSERAIADLRTAQRQLDAARSDEAFWRNQTLATYGGGSRDEASPARRMQMLDLSTAEMKAKGFTEKHPDMIKVRQEYDELTAALTRSEEEEAADDAPVSAAMQGAEAERRRAAFRLESSQADMQRLELQLEEIQLRMAATPRVAEQLESLNRLYSELTTSLRDFGKRRQEASVQADLERRQLGEQFRVLEAAFPPVAPSAPNRLIVLMMGLLAGLALGAGAGIVAESLDSSVHGPRELQAALGVPVLVSIPAIVLESDRVTALRRRVRTAVAAATVVAFCLVGGAATYMVVNGAPGWLSNLVTSEEAAEPGAALDAEPRRTAAG